MPHRLIMALQVVAMMFVAASISGVMKDGWICFPLNYIINRALTAYLYWRADRVGAETTCFASEQGRNFFLVALFDLSSVLPFPMACWVFGLGVLLIQLQHMLSYIGALRFERCRPRLSHLSERLSLMMLILFGEGFLNW